MTSSALKLRPVSAFVLAAGLLAAQDTRVLTLPVPAPGQGTSTVYVPGQASRATGARGLMWKAASATNTVYLVGSIHFGTPDMYPLPAAIESAFENSAVLVVEINLNKVNPSETLGFFAANGMYPEGDSLWNHVSARTRDLLTAFCSTRGLSSEMFARLKPWAASLTLSTLLMQSAGFQAELGIDMHFLKQAAGTKRVEQLETIDQQLHMFSRESPAEQERGLAEAAGHPERYSDLAARLKSAWLNGDAKALETLMTSAFRESPGSEKRLLGERNPHMAAMVEQYLGGNEPHFVVVGAGHLVGKTGLVNTLRRKGFAVTQVLSAD
jgi:uncharacterized protein YbaP (TraB family)